jgi:hypothetical protein
MSSQSVLHEFIAESVTVRVKRKVPISVGVPFNIPELITLRPAGREPAVIAQVKGAIPPPPWVKVSE